MPRQLKLWINGRRIDLVHGDILQITDQTGLGVLGIDIDWESERGGAVRLQVGTWPDGEEWQQIGEVSL